MMKKHMITLALLLTLTACTKAPALKIYTLDIPQTTVTQSSHYHTKTIKITYPQSLREQMSQKMNFSYSMSDRGTYQNSEWSNNMSKLLQGTIIDLLDSSRLFKAVLSDTSTLKENYRLESNIFAFEHRVRGESSHAVVSIQFTLIDADTGKLVKSRRFSYQEPTPSIDAKGYATATNVIMRRLSSDLVGWLR
jgi:cholesterol transport system auxiliary component